MAGVGLAFLIAGALQVDSSPRDPETIVNGSDAMTCEFPAAAAILRDNGSHACTVVLVHPRVVLLAAHCLLTGELETVAFGEDALAPAVSVAVEGCESHPDGLLDLAYCTLAADAPAVPIVPPLMGCEADELIAGATITLAGYGMNDEANESGHGIKRWTTNTVETVDTEYNNLYLLGTDGSSVCFGDSGGPAYLELSDGTWRVVGVTSDVHPDAFAEPLVCGYGAIYELVHLEMAWFEQQTGHDLTPCFDPDGTWSADETCGGFPTSLTTAGLEWPAACATEEVSGWSATCGEPWQTEGTGSSSSGDESTTAVADTGDTTGPQPPDTSTSDESSSTSTSSMIDADSSGSTGPMQRDVGDDGCGCNSTRAPAGSLAWIVLLLASGGARRALRRAARRSASCR